MNHCQVGEDCDNCEDKNCDCACHVDDEEKEVKSE